MEGAGTESGLEPVAVTGASGFIGSNLCRFLTRAGHTVRAIHRAPRSDAADPGAVRVTGLEDRAGLGRAFDGARAVVHLAGRAHRMDEDPSEAAARFFRVNTRGTEVAVEEAEKAGVRRFILASSVKAVGEDSGREPWTTDTVPRPRDPYGESKLAAERVLLDRARSSGMEAVAIRLPLVYGPGVKANMLRLFTAVDRGTPLPLGAIDNRRSMLYLENLNAAIARLLEAPSMGRGVYFLSDGEDLSTGELTRRIGHALGREARLVPVPETLFRLGGRILDVLGLVLPLPGGSAEVQRLLGSLQVDPTPFFDRYDFTPPHTVADGLTATAEWYRTEAERRRHDP